MLSGDLNIAVLSLNRGLMTKLISHKVTCKIHNELKNGYRLKERFQEKYKGRDLKP